tara:strand:+ start:742 stop:1017 length:276 start_codon:yes stop_codon:yes gene_type:complete
MIRGAPVAMAKKNRDRKKNQSMLRDLRSRNERSNNASASYRPRGRTQAERDAAAAAAAAAKLAAERAAGQKRRKAFEKAKTTILFNKDKKA